MNHKLIRWVERGTMTLGASGLILVLVGGGGSLLGISAKAVQKLGTVLKPHEVTTQRMVNYGSALLWTGTFLAGSGVIIARALGEVLPDADLSYETEVNLESQSPKTRCQACDYFSDNMDYLCCAVNPDMPVDCSHFLPVSSAKLNQ